MTQGLGLLSPRYIWSAILAKTLPIPIILVLKAHQN
jgi:hypothetical protein